MNAVLHDLAVSFTEPTLLFGHFTYLLLIVSMLMRNIVWLRSIAIAAGVAKVMYRAFFVLDPVSVLWEAVFVLVNVWELAYIWWQNRPPELRDEERVLLATIAPNLSTAVAKALLADARWQEAPAGTALTSQGVPVGGLIYVARGRVQVDVDGRNVGDCGPGDFIGEMTWSDEAAATASATAGEAVRYVWFERQQLAATMKRFEVLRFALQGSISRNLIEKLKRTTGRIPA